MDKRFVGILAAIVVVFGVIFAVSQHSNNKTTGTSSSTSSTQSTHHIEGDGSKTGVTFVEYGDYECPVCELYYPTMKQVAAKYANQIYFQFRNLPLTQVHPNAFAGARAAEAAGLQNKYWQMHDALYDNQNTWAQASDPTTYFNTYAQQIGLNLNQFKTDYASAKVNDAINADLAAFMKTGQPEATPTFFLDGKYVDNNSLVDQSGPSLTAFSKVIDAEIAKKTQK